MNLINERLKKALSFVEHCECMADIGSDHGYASIYVLENGIVNNVIATDISRPSLAKTEKLVERAGLLSKVQCRCGDGFKVLKKHEANVAFVAGMGADLIADIVENSEEISRNLDYMVLQPMNSAEPLRMRLNKNGYSILREAVIEENGKWYSILKMKNGQSPELSDAEKMIGTFVFKDKIEFAEDYILYLKNHYEKILKYVGNNATQSAENGIKEAKRRLEIVERALEWARS